MYTRAWDETSPAGTVLADTLDTVIQNFKTDIRERVAGIFGLSSVDFSADPIVPKTLSLSGDAVINGLTIGKAFNSIVTNTAFGVQVLLAVGLLGIANTGVGYQALANNIDAPGNVAVGYGCMGGFLTGNGANTSAGYQSASAHTTATQNASFGYWSLRSTTTGSNNAALGYRAGMSMVSGNYNVMVGYATLDAACGDQNTAIGGFAATVNTGTNNTIGGYFSLGANTTGTQNTSWGVATLKSNLSGSRNVALGYFAGAYELGSDAFYVDNQDRLNTANDKAKAMFYGVFNAAPASQTLVINAATTISQTLAVTGGITANLTGSVTGNVSGNLTGTILTAAQPNITSVGTLTTLAVGGGGISTTGSFVQTGAAGDNQIAGRIRFTNLWSGALAAGTIYQRVDNGLFLVSVAGSTNDFLLAAPAGGTIFRVPTGTVGVTFAGAVTAASFSGPLTGNVTGNATGSAGSAPAGALTGATLAAGVTTSSLTSVGTLTALSLGGALTFTPATSQIIPGATSLSIRNSGNTQDNYLFNNTGKATFLGDGAGGISIDLLNTGKYAVNGTQVVGQRITGWATATAAGSRTAIAVGDTLAQTIAHLAQLKEDITSHGMIGV